MSSGDSWMDEEKWQFLLDNWGLIYKAAHSWNKKADGVPLEECVSGAMMMAVHCLRSFDPKTARWSTYYMRAASSTQQMWRWIDRPGTYFSAERPDLRELLESQGNMMSLNIALDHDDGKLDSREHSAVQRLTARSDDHTDEQAISNIDAEHLHRAIEKLPHQLRKHAWNTLTESVSWTDPKRTARLRREMLEELRRLMYDEEDLSMWGDTGGE